VVIKVRARREEDKRERREAILDAALELWDGRAHGDLSMAHVAERAGLAKGTLYLYFATKEGLLLGLLERELGRWFAELDGFLDGARTLDADTLAQALAGSLLGRDPLVRLLTILETILEHNIDEPTARAFKLGMRDRLLSTGGRLERGLGFLAAGEGARLLLYLHALLVGLARQADPAPVIREVQKDPALALFRIDFQTELRRAARAMLLGFAAQAREGDKP
jgi:AcrR family transcriptional regulator